VLDDKKLEGKAHDVHLDQIIELQYKDEKEIKPLQIRMVTYYDEDKRKYDFITNCLEELNAEEIAGCYKKRWDIELLFKKLKQNFQLSYFYGENQTAIKSEIWCTLIAQLLISVIQKQHAPEKAFSTIASSIRIHTISMLSLVEIVKGDHKYYAKEKPMAGLMDLFGNFIPRRKEKNRNISSKKGRGHFSDTVINPIMHSDNQLVDLC